MCVCVCACMHKTTRHCLSFKHGCWLRPRQGQRQVEGGEQREEKQGASRVSQFGASCQGACHARLQAFKPRTRMLCREAWSGGRALLAGPVPFVLAGPSPILLADLSLLFLKFTANYPELHIKFYRVCWLSPLQFPGDPDRLWAAPPGQPIILLFISAPGRDVQP